VWAGRAASLARKHKLIAISVFEDGERSPLFGLGVFCEFHAFGLQRLRGRENIVAPECHRLKTSDAIFVALGREQGKLGFSSGNALFDPSLPPVARRVGKQLI
jgi:hypothetical protein